MTWHYVEKEFNDYAADIEAVKINYLWTPFGGDPDWDQRATLFMPRIARRSPLRKRRLKIPQQILDPASGAPADRIVLHYYFEIIQDGQRHYSQLYTEEIATGAELEPSVAESVRVPRTDRAIA
jgi:hypothetical protein